MRPLRFLFVGKSHNAALRDLEGLYLKKISLFQKTELILIKDADGPQQQRIKKETHSILEKTTPQDQLILLDETGLQFDSLTFAKKLDFWRRLARPTAFIIGGAYGVDLSQMPKNLEKIALSSFTFPHELARVILLEQIYRACSILGKTGYHHD